MNLSNLETICRVCLDSKYSLKSIFDDISRINIAQLIMECAPIQIYANDGLPSKICCECLDKLKVVKDLKLLLISSDTKLRRKLLDDTKLKVETECQMSDELETIDLDIVKNEIADINDVKNNLENSADHFDNNCQNDAKIDKFRITMIKKFRKKANQPNNHLDKVPKKVKKTKSAITYKCDVCNKHCTTQFHLNLHKQRHNKSICHICGKIFQCNAYLDEHIRIHNGNHGFQCDYCQKKFFRRSIFKDHLRIHTGERPYICAICGKSFKQHAHIRVHKRIVHEKVQNFECDTCHKKFTRKYVLDIHKRIHTGEKPYECKLCNKKFPHSGNLFNHKKVHEKQTTIGQNEKN